MIELLRVNTGGYLKSLPLLPVLFKAADVVTGSVFLAAVSFKSVLGIGLGLLRDEDRFDCWIMWELDVIVLASTSCLRIDDEGDVPLIEALLVDVGCCLAAGSVEAATWLRDKVDEARDLIEPALDDGDIRVSGDLTLSLEMPFELMFSRILLTSYWFLPVEESKSISRRFRSSLSSLSVGSLSTSLVRARYSVSVSKHSYKNSTSSRSVSHSFCKSSLKILNH